MNPRITCLALTGAIAALLMAGCGSSSCNANNCAGCCDAAGVCQGASAAHCGVNGAACETCVAAQSCVLGTCSFVGGNGNGTGSGNNSGNGSSGSSATTCSNCGTASGSNGSNGTGTTTQGSSSTVSSTGGSDGSSAAAASTGTSGTSSSSSTVSTTGTSSSSSTVSTTGTSSSSGTVSTTGTSSSSTTTTSTSTTGTSGTGTTTGGTCPNNMPDILNGQAGGSCTTTACATGFTCVSGQCLLNGSSGDLQITLSWDNFEDLDVHVIEPNGCAVWYGATNNPHGSSACAGSLDRDSNSACQANDGVEIENVIYPAGVAAPTGTYTVVVDDWQDCDSATSFNYGLQVRKNGVVTRYCGTVLSTDADGCGGPNTCTHGKIITFTVP